MAIGAAKSSSRKSGRVLAAHRTLKPGIARKFLSNLANMSDDSQAVARFETHFGPVYLQEVPMYAVRAWASQIEQRHQDELDEVKIVRNYWLLPLRDAVRTVWSLRDVRSKRLAVYGIVTQLLSPGDSRFSFAPMHNFSDFFNETLRSPTRLARILDELVDERSHHLAHKCRNPKCLSPFFFASRRSHKYCSEVCAIPAQREAKRKWWKAHGHQWRSTRKSSVITACTKRSQRRG